MNILRVDATRNGDHPQHGSQQARACPDHGSALANLSPHHLRQGTDELRRGIDAQLDGLLVHDLADGQPQGRL